MLDQIASSFSNFLESTPNSSRQDELKNHIHLLLRSALRSMDLVTREEFDAQQAVLLRTRERLEALEKEVEKLESNAS